MLHCNKHRVMLQRTNTGIPCRQSQETRHVPVQ
jgi:hypothetical protein